MRDGQQRGFRQAEVGPCEKIRTQLGLAEPSLLMGQGELVGESRPG